MPHFYNTNLNHEPKTPYNFNKHWSLLTNIELESTDFCSKTFFKFYLIKKKGFEYQKEDGTVDSTHFDTKLHNDKEN